MISVQVRFALRKNRNAAGWHALRAPDNRRSREKRCEWVAPGMTLTADRLLLFGATGDLSQRMLLPSLCALDADGLLEPDLKIVGTARSEMSTKEFRDFAREALEKYLPDHRRGGVAEFLNRLSYVPVDATTLEGYDELAREVGEYVKGLTVLFTPG